MAVVQISRIQVRRGKANSGTGIPQLASGEMAWALDTQELYIGSGSVAEGAPAVGNTRVLTEVDLGSAGGIINSLQYVYKLGSGVQTGTSPNIPVSRTFQSRFDDVTTGLNFGVVGDETTNVTVQLQRAIDQLFLNPTTGKSSLSSVAGVKTRVTLILAPGIYTITGTIYIPSYASIEGSGPDKTIIKHSGTGPVFRFVNDTSTPGNPATLASTVSNTRPKGILLKGMTIQTSTGTQTALKLDAVKDSVFEDLNIIGTWAGTYNANSQGINMSVVSSLVNCENNIFKNINISGFSYGVWAKQDILNNAFHDCNITDVRQGVVFGQGANGSTIGEQYGPRGTIISNTRFIDVKQQGILIELGTRNSVVDSKFINVGNNGGGNSAAVYPQVYFGENENSYVTNVSDRADDLAGSLNSTVPYVPELAGRGTFQSYGTRKITIGQINNNYLLAFRLPVSTDSFGGPQRSITYSIDYIYRSTGNNYTRSGTIDISVDVEQGYAQLSDDYNVVNIASAEAVKFEFRTTLLNANGTEYTHALGTVPYSIAVEYQNSISGDAGILQYSYSSTF